jgi:hypothetical protein
MSRGVGFFCCLCGKIIKEGERVSEIKRMYKSKVQSKLWAHSKCEEAEWDFDYEEDYDPNY